MFSSVFPLPSKRGNFQADKWSLWELCSCQNETWSRCPKSWRSFVTPALKILECVARTYHFIFVLIKQGVGYFPNNIILTSLTLGQLFCTCPDWICRHLCSFLTPSLYLGNSYRCLSSQTSRQESHYIHFVTRCTLTHAQDWILFLVSWPLTFS